MLSISDDLHRVLTDLAHVSGTPRSSIPAKLLEDNLPVFEEILSILNIARSKPREAAEKMREGLLQNMIDAAQMRLVMNPGELESMKKFTDD